MGAAPYRKGQVLHSVFAAAPYIQMYEFEGLLFSSPEGLATGISQHALREQFQQIRDAFDTPETIKNSRITAPSKRILNLYDGY
jgi:hypothetical protein